MTPWLIAFVIALILLKAALGERRSTKNFSWNSTESARSTSWAYALVVAALAFILAAVVLAS